MQTLGTLYAYLDRTAESELWTRKALEGYRKLPGREEDATWMMANLARVLVNQGAFEEAEKLLQEATQTCVRVLGPDHPNMCRLIQLSMAELCESAGRYEEARTLWAEVAKGKSKLLGARHKETLDARRWVADLSSRLGDWKTSTECYDVLSTIEGGDSFFRGAISARLAGQSNVCDEMCRSILKQSAQTTNATFAARAAMALLLLPEAVTNLEAACRLADMALAAKPESLWRQTSRGMAAYRLGRWQEALGSGVDWAVEAVAVSGTDLYAGGRFTTAGGVAATNIAKWNGSAWSALGAGIHGGVFALAVSGTNLYVGGGFTTAGEVTANRIARWNVSGWSALGSGMNNPVWALAVSGTNLYVGGGFTTAGEVTANYIAKWNGSAWSALGSGMNDSVAAPKRFYRAITP